MKKGYDFSKGVRGKFYRPSAQLNIHVYIDSDVASAMQKFAKKRKINIGSLVNAWLRRDIESMNQPEN